MLFRNYLFTIHLTFTLIFCGVNCFSQTERGTILYVSDGDSFRMITKNGTKLRIRIADIDCPEKTQAYGLEAKEFVLNTLNNKEVYIIIKDTDRYGRKIARVCVEGKDLARELLRNGFAWHYTEHSDDEKLKKLELKARKKKLGLWADENPVAPWDYRKMLREKNKRKTKS